MTVRVGDLGRAMASLHPQGVVQIDGRRYHARSDFDSIEPGTEVVILRGDLQGLVVRAVEPGETIERVPGYGKAVHSSFGELLTEHQKLESAEQESWQARLPRWRAARRGYGFRMGALLGALFAAIGLGLSWEYVNQAVELPWVLALGVTGVGILWGVGVFLLLDRTQQWLLKGMLPQVEERVYDRLTLLATGLGLLGATAGAVLVIPRSGLGLGLAVAIVATCVLGLIVPGFLMANAPADD
jgi:hypothetical protein